MESGLEGKGEQYKYVNDAKAKQKAGTGTPTAAEKRAAKRNSK